MKSAGTSPAPVAHNQRLDGCEELVETPIKYIKCSVVLSSGWGWCSLNRRSFLKLLVRFSFGVFVAFLRSTSAVNTLVRPPPVSLSTQRLLEMDGTDELGGLRGLFQDLSSLSRSALPNVERLVFELEAAVKTFRQLLDKRTKNNASRQTVLSGKLDNSSLRRIARPYYCGCY